MKFSLTLSVLAIASIANGAAIKRFQVDDVVNEGDPFAVGPVKATTTTPRTTAHTTASEFSFPSIPAQFKENPFWGWWFLYQCYPEDKKPPFPFPTPSHKSEPSHHFTKFENHTLHHFPTPTFSFPEFPFPTGFPAFPSNFTFPTFPTDFSFPPFPTEFSFPSAPTEFSFPPFPTDFSFPAIPTDFSFPAIPTEFSFPPIPSFSFPTIPTTHIEFPTFPTPTIKAPEFPTLPTVVKDPFTAEEPKLPTLPTAKVAEPKEGFF
ncbi:hypothetical protein DFJ63DRAFT_310113 [Scheffersomyces coipomensis]|uniref:uncharacterized protein n=1 Tax=Scheffersomyces coipomensis TaxID=1788519 RepID=UPI00315D964C